MTRPTTANDHALLAVCKSAGLSLRAFDATQDLGGLRPVPLVAGPAGAAGSGPAH